MRNYCEEIYLKILWILHTPIPLNEKNEFLACCNSVLCWYIRILGRKSPYILDGMINFIGTHYLKVHTSWIPNNPSPKIRKILREAETQNNDFLINGSYDFGHI
jgi:hypothetical protein